MSFELYLAKESFKFSGTHFTILGPEKAERLHGHNYYVEVRLKFQKIDSEFGFAFDFNQIKPAVRKLCDHLDEHILIPLNSRYLKIERTKEQIQIQFGTKIYSFPRSDVVELPLSNITSEELARHLSERLNLEFKNLEYQSLTVAVEETRGQGASFTLYPSN